MDLRYFVLFLVASLAFGAIAHPQKDRVVDHHLSNKEPGSPDYDHEAFLGKEDAEDFKNLDEDESKRRLGIIADQIDKDGDSLISEDELSAWITFTQQRYIREDADKQFGTYDKDGDGTITWEEYKKTSYGFLDDEPEPQDEESERHSYKRMIERDEKRWKVADSTGDGACSMEEFRAFMHPEEYAHMKEIVVQETLDDIDKNKDGVIGLEEYIGDMHDSEEGDPPDWLEEEKKQFTEFRDKNKDGHLDFQEVRKWILPEDHNYAKSEAQHLIQEADSDKDGMLSKDEVIDNHKIFVDSQATDFGEALNRHDEF